MVSRTAPCPGGAIFGRGCAPAPRLLLALLANEDLSLNRNHRRHNHDEVPLPEARYIGEAMARGRCGGAMNRAIQKYKQGG